MSPRPPAGPGARNAARRDAGAHTYSLSEATALLSLSRSVIVRLVASGYVKPARGTRGEYRFSFADMVLLRTARGLQAAQIPPRRIVHSLRRLRESLPAQVPLTGLRIAAIGNEVVVRDGGSPWQADTGQLLFDFDVAPGAGTVRELRMRAPANVELAGRSQGRGGAKAARGETDGSAAGGALRPQRAAADAAQWFEHAVGLERDNPAAAEDAYRRAIAAAPGHADAYLNLGVLLGEAGRHAEAADVYRDGLAHCPTEALLQFNLGVALEDQRRFDEAAAAYEACLALDPSQADAHFNLARLHDQAGRQRQAIRHYSAYRRLQAARR